MSEVKWSKVVRPKKWRAAEGEVLEGIYVGAGDRRSGERTWKELYVRETASGIVYGLSGSVLENLFGVVPLDSLVRIVFLGKKPCSTKDWMFNDYDLYVGTIDQTFGQPVPKAAGLWS